jgi:hypothetical protein
MGASNVKAVYNNWGHLDPVAFRLLVYMALVSMDGDSPVYWGGREELTSAIGRPLVDPLDQSAATTQRVRATSFRALRRALRLLTVAKVVEMTVTPAPGRHAEYALRLSMERGTHYGPPSDVDNPGDSAVDSAVRQLNGGRSVVTTEDTGGRNGGRSVVTTEDSSCPPKEQLRSTRNNRGRTDLRTDVAVARARPAVDSRSDSHLARQRITLRVVDGTGPPTGGRSQPVATQPALWPVLVREENDVSAQQARQSLRDALSNARVARATARARQTAHGNLGPVSGHVPEQPRTHGPTCSECGTGLDPDRTCYICRDGRVQAS